MDLRNVPAKSLSPNDVIAKYINDLMSPRFSPVSSRFSFIGKYIKYRNTFLNAIWPTSLWQLFMMIGSSAALLSLEPEFAAPVTAPLRLVADSALPMRDSCPRCVRIAVTSVVCGVAMFAVFLCKRRLLLRTLLSYNHWIYEGRTISFRTRVWALCIRFLSNHRSSSMFSCQSILPRQPLPSLDDTMQKLVRSMRTLYGEDSEEFKYYLDESTKFRNGIGRKLQRLLYFKSWWADNWVSDWWIKYMYLSSRASLSINSNFYMVDQMHWLPTSRPISRASYVISELLKSNSLIEHHQIPVISIMDTVPTCMQQYRDIYGSVRVPGVTCDRIEYYKSSHICVQYRGIYYELSIYDASGKCLSCTSWEQQLQSLMHDADLQCEHLPMNERWLPSLTALGRTDWANLRNKHFKSGLNRESLKTIESSLFHVILDNDENASTWTWSERCKRLLHGNGYNGLWFDKIMNVVVFKDAHYGISIEHTLADAPVVAHLHRNIIIKECTGNRYDERGYCAVDRSRRHHHHQSALVPSRRIAWQVGVDLDRGIQAAVRFSVKSTPDKSDSQGTGKSVRLSEMSDLSEIQNIMRQIRHEMRSNNENADLVMQEFTYYGMNFIKKCKLSPDSFIQTAIQLAYYRQSNGQFVHTYEPAMMRLYRNGRTETIRSLSDEKKAFIKSMDDDSLPREAKIELLRRVSINHKKLCCDAMAGKGIDRHLFALYITARGLGLKSELLEKALLVPWKLSTSTSPSLNSAENIPINKDKYRYMLCGGGGFGAVSSQGYGISYIGPGGKRIYFHITSSKSCKETDSTKMKDALFHALYDMRRLFEPTIPEQPHEYILFGCVDDLTYDLAPLDDDSD